MKSLSVGDEKESSDRKTDAACDDADLLSSRDISLRVTGLASDGDGVGRLEDGRVVFVDGGVPGDLVELVDLTTRKKVARARVGRLLESSPDRVEARCGHFGTCGGCRWQHIRYEAQLEAKRRMVRDALERIGGFPPDRDIEILASPEPYGYRARARLVESAGVIGYRMRGSRESIAIEECPILTPKAQEGLAQLTESLATDGCEESIASSNAKTRRRRTTIEWIISAGAADLSIARAGRGKSSSGKIPESISIEVLGERLRVSSNSFMQGNGLLWDALADEVCRQCTKESDTASGESASTEGSPEHFVELYAGIGFLTCPLARRGLSGVAVEGDRSASSDLKFNLRETGLAERVEVIRARVESRRDLTKRFSTTDLLLVDPPRIGLDGDLRAVIARAGPRRLVYVSCDPATLARDLRILAEAGYVLGSVRAMDLFPQTPHVEIIARLDRN